MLTTAGSLQAEGTEDTADGGVPGHRRSRGAGLAGSNLGLTLPSNPILKGTAVSTNVKSVDGIRRLAGSGRIACGWVSIAENGTLNAKSLAEDVPGDSGCVLILYPKNGLGKAGGPEKEKWAKLAVRGGWTVRKAGNPISAAAAVDQQCQPNPALQSPAEPGRASLASHMHLSPEPSVHLLLGHGGLGITGGVRVLYYSYLVVLHV